VNAAGEMFVFPIEADHPSSDVHTHVP
jgi:hypothetical protein